MKTGNFVRPCLYIYSYSSIKNIGQSLFEYSKSVILLGAKYSTVGHNFNFLTFIFIFSFLLFEICVAQFYACTSQNILLTSPTIACPSHVNRPRPMVGMRVDQWTSNSKDQSTLQSKARAPKCGATCRTYFDLTGKGGRE